MKLGIALFLAGLPGVVVAAVVLIPALLRFTEKIPPVPLPVILTGAIAQSAVLLALAVWAGVSFSSRVGLQAPVFSALVEGRSPVMGFRATLLPGLAGGALGGLLILVFHRYPPAALASVQTKLTPPLSVRVLYGGITEELLTRWGLMSLLLWIAWKVMQRSSGAPELPYVWAAIVISAILFGVGHLPITKALIGKLTQPVIAYVVAGNAIFGLIAGYLFWRDGLEAAMMAHASAHVISWIGALLWRSPAV